MQLRGYPFRPTLITVVITVIAVGTGSVTIAARRNAYSLAHALWQNSSQHLAAEAAQQALRFVEPAVPYVEHTRNLVRLGRLPVTDDDAVLRHLRASLEAHPHFTWASFGRSDGTYLTAYRTNGRMVLGHRTQLPTGGTRIRVLNPLPDGTWTVAEERVGHYDPRERPWYRDALANEDGHWGEPYIFQSNREPGFIYSARQRAGEQLQGVWTVEYEGSYLSRFLSTLRIGSGGRVFVVTPEGRVVGHPDGQVAERSGSNELAIARAEHHSDASLRDTYRAWRALGGGSRSFEFPGHLAMAQQLPAETRIPWVVLVVVPSEQVYGPVEREVFVHLLIAVLTALVAMALGVSFSNRVSAALQDIAAELERVGRFDVEKRPLLADKSFVREVSAMAQSAEHMKASLRSFGKYVPRDVVSDLLASGQDAVLGGRKEELTVFFSDIAGFTSIAEKLEADQLVEALGEYLHTASEALMQQGGTVDKFIGDAIMAFWGAPRKQEDHALRACRAVLLMLERLDVLRQQWKAKGRPDFRCRVGLNTGRVVVGNIGSPERMNYTVMGDAVNVASRLEGLNKAYGSTVLLGEETARMVQESMELRLIDHVAVKGRVQAMRVYELLGEKGKVSQERLAAVKTYEAALEQYRARAFDEAGKLFAKAREQFGGSDGPSEKLLARCGAYLSSPPPPDWDGSYAMDTK